MSHLLHQHVLGEEQGMCTAISEQGELEGMSPGGVTGNISGSSGVTSPEPVSAVSAHTAEPPLTSAGWHLFRALFCFILDWWQEQTAVQTTLSGVSVHKNLGRWEAFVSLMLP